jgi:simple sugar transport system ATP-binding protein
MTDTVPAGGLASERTGPSEERLGRSTDVAIRASGIVKRFGHVEALRGATIEVRAGEIVALVGDNGAGKSTLAKIICGALQPDAGEIAFWGEPTAVQSINHAYELGLYTVYQDLAQAPDLSVAENFFLGRELLAGGVAGRLGVLARDRMEAETREALARLGIRLKSISAPVRDLSGGQRQALAVARANSWASTGLIMDEPTAALGARQTGIVYDTIRAAAARGLAVLVISHDIPRMVSVAHRVAVMRHGLVIEDRLATGISVEEVIALMLGAVPGRAA